jgi:hypothetical protein
LKANLIKDKLILEQPFYFYLKPCLCMKKILLLLLAGSLFYTGELVAQDKLNVKYGKITPQDFALTGAHFDSMATGVVIADIGDATFEGSNKGFFSIVFRHFRRAKILDKKAIAELGKVSLDLYSNGRDEEKLDNLKAHTYNLENGTVVETKLDDKSIFTDKTSKHFISKKFTFPNLKEGSIIEYTYTTRSDFLYNLQSWEFQDQFPILWSEYEVSIPQYFTYVPMSQGYQNFFVRKNETSSAHYTVTTDNGSERNETTSLDATVNINRWVMKDVPALKPESYTTTIQNHIAKIEFQLSMVHFPNSAPHETMGNWQSMSKELMLSETFGDGIKRNNGWLSDELKQITAGAGSKLEKAQKIYSWVKQHFVCKSYGRLRTENPLKTVFKNRSGSEAEINLLLAAMLNHEDIDADPVILSRRDNGYVHPMYPLIDRFNYVIAAAHIDGRDYYLDASHSSLGFGHLPDYLYNGQAQLINADNPRPVIFSPDSLRENKFTSVMIYNDEQGDGMNGTLQTTMGEIGSFALREKVGTDGAKGYFAQLKKTSLSDLTLQNEDIDSLNLADYPVKLHYDFAFKPNAENGLIYFTPMMGEAMKKNPFEAATRTYPVEMNYPVDEMYTLSMEIPKGYVVDELPKSAKVAFNENEGFFEYLVVKDDANVQLRTRIKLNKATFPADDYAVLRDFYAFIVKKQSEQIVFKKK